MTTILIRASSILVTALNAGGRNQANWDPDGGYYVLDPYQRYFKSLNPPIFYMLSLGMTQTSANLRAIALSINSSQRK